MYISRVLRMKKFYSHKIILDFVKIKFSHRSCFVGNFTHLHILMKLQINENKMSAYYYEKMNFR